MTAANDLLLPSLRIRKPRSGPVALRRLGPSDAGALSSFFARLTGESLRRRFLSPLTRVPDRLILRLVDVDRRHHFAVAATISDGAGERIVAEARFVSTDESPSVCEFAIAICDEWQGMGLGRRLLDELERYARDAGMDALEGECLTQNEPMQALARKCGFRVSRHRHEPGLMKLHKDLQGDPHARKSSARQAPNLGPAWARQTGECG